MKVPEGCIYFIITIIFVAQAAESSAWQCSSKSDCYDCSHSYGCAWCRDENNATLASCVEHSRCRSDFVIPQNLCAGYCDTPTAVVNSCQGANFEKLPVYLRPQTWSLFLDSIASQPDCYVARQSGVLGSSSMFAQSVVEASWTLWDSASASCVDLFQMCTSAGSTSCPQNCHRASSDEMCFPTGFPDQCVVNKDTVSCMISTNCVWNGVNCTTKCDCSTQDTCCAPQCRSAYCVPNHSIEWPSMLKAADSCPACFRLGKSLQRRHEELVAGAPLLWNDTALTPLCWDSLRSECTDTCDGNNITLNFEDCFGEATQPLLAKFAGENVEPVLLGNLINVGFALAIVVLLLAMFLELPVRVLKTVRRKVGNVLALADLQRQVIPVSPGEGKPLYDSKSGVGGFTTLVLAMAVVVYAVWIGSTLNTAPNITIVTGMRNNILS
eukprot:TRINITY_DN10683_c0_g1_i2.p1 TRINITY_DN10683_c0_g1~~TRINITY_DN10683_c0_g1_i2.p1  ORF type:complete len:439 (+),score=56.97 TRINITY_DN10683_c0_g1_i2:30-1346(+)